MGLQKMKAKPELGDIATRLRAVRAARRQFLLLWAMQDAQPVEKIILTRALHLVDRSDPVDFLLDD